MSDRKYPQADVKILYGLAAGRCAFPKCRKELILEGEPSDKAKQIGKIGHIIAHSDGGPRADLTYPRDKLDTYENWVLLCPTCHDTVDTLQSQYSVEFLRNLKTEHETWVHEKLDESMSDIGFAELEVAIKGISVQTVSQPPEFSIVPPDKKIKKNSLSDPIRKRIAMGLMQGEEVRQFLEGMEQIDSGFVDRLVAGFKQKYIGLRDTEGLTSDAIFAELQEFSCNGSSDFNMKAAGLALLVHFFEACEVFEK